MKKVLFLLWIIGSICACTTPEEDAQIKLFWMEQILQLMPQQARPMPLPPQPLPVMPEEEIQQQPQVPAEQPPVPEDLATQPQAATEQSATHQTASVPVPKPQVHRSQNQFIEITMEDARVKKTKSSAPLKDRQAMQRAIERVKQSNQQTLTDIGTMFDGDTQAQAFAIVAKSEKILMRVANTSNTYQNYLNAQRKILQEQEAQLNQLMRQNAYKLRRIRG